MVFLVLTAAVGSVALAADEPSAGSAVERETGSANEAGVKGRVPREVREATAISALAMWAGILAIGLTLVAMVIFWGRRLRRVARERGFSSTAPDPLWYLKSSSTAHSANRSEDLGPAENKPNDFDDRPLP